MTEQRGHHSDQARRRLLVFGLHLLGCCAVLAGLFLYGAVQGKAPLNPVLIVIGWGSVLALHAAYVMGLFGVFTRQKKENS